jgi:Tfp pilus assembly protein PilP
MTMVSRTAGVFVLVLLACSTTWAQGQAAIGAARGARSAVEQASQGAQPSGAGQPPATAAPQAPAAQAPAAPPPSPLEPPGFTYNPEGRRDPFVSLVRRGTATTRGAGTGARPAGLAGLETAEVTLRGTVRSREGFVAILQGADQKTYIVRAGDKLLDGTVRTISQNDMVILQQVNDPLSLEKQREVRKVLRQAEAN